METFYQKLQKLSHDGQSKEVDLQALYKTKYSEYFHIPIEEITSLDNADTYFHTQVGSTRICVIAEAKLRDTDANLKSVPYMTKVLAQLVTYIHKFVYSAEDEVDRKSTRLNSSHQIISYAVFCLKKQYYDK